jgi:hypothetical protein
MKRIFVLSLFPPLLSCGVSTCLANDAAVKPAVIEAARFASLQAAFDAVPTNGGVVLLPPGEFVLSKPLVLSVGNTRVEGAGPATHLINGNTNGKPALIIRPRDIEKNPRAKLWRVQLGNFRISGNTNSGDGLFALGINELFLHGLAVDHNGGHGISLRDCTEDPRVVNSIITYNARAGLNIFSTHDIVVSANQFEENQDAVRCINSYNLTMNGNNVDDHLRHGVVIENTYGSVLSGNMIEECNGVAVLLDRDCYGITVSANVIADHLGGGVHLLDAWGCTISANTFVLVHSNSVLVSSNSGRLTITGNNFCNSYIGGGQDKRKTKPGQPIGFDEATGIALQSISDIVIAGNQFSGLSGQAVVAEGKCKRIVVTGNVVTDYGRRLPKKMPAIDLGKASASIVKNNVIGVARPLPGLKQ